MDTTTHAHWPGLLRLLALLAVPLAFFVAACGSSDSGSGQQVQPDGSQEVPGALTNLPRPDAATPAGSPTFTSGTWTQSFQVEGSTPFQVMQFYEEEMPGAGYELTTAPAQDGKYAYTATFTGNGAAVTVSTSPFQGSGGGDQTQLNLEYRA